MTGGRRIQFIVTLCVFVRRAVDMLLGDTRTQGSKKVEEGQESTVGIIIESQQLQRGTSRTLLAHICYGNVRSFCCPASCPSPSSRFAHSRRSRERGNERETKFFDEQECFCHDMCDGFDTTTTRDDTDGRTNLVREGLALFDLGEVPAAEINIVDAPTWGQEWYTDVGAVSACSEQRRATSS